MFSGKRTFCPSQRSTNWGRACMTRCGKHLRFWSAEGSTLTCECGTSGPGTVCSLGVIRMTRPFTAWLRTTILPFLLALHCMGASRCGISGMAIVYRLVVPRYLFLVDFVVLGWIRRSCRLGPHQTCDQFPEGTIKCPIYVEREQILIGMNECEKLEKLRYTIITHTKLDSA